MKANESSVNGIFLLNKPEGVSSNFALQKAKRLFGAKKAGHSGSLDPLATGMLPICFGEATKICHYLLHADKCYETTGILGVKTNSGDSTGEIIALVNDFSITEAKLIDTLLQFNGAIKQVPSMFSALKHKGKALYHYARQGVTVEREAREILIKNLQLDTYDGRQFTLKVVCSKGTYIRNLVEDIGDVLGVGAHVSRLHRVYTSGFENMPMYTLDELEAMSVEEKNNCLIPMDRAVDYLPQVVLSDMDVIKIRQGLSVPCQNNMTLTDCVRLYDQRSQFIGLGEQDARGDLKPKRLLSF